MNSRGCNPRWAGSNEHATLEGSNDEGGGQAFGPFRADDIVALPTVGLRPRLFTLKPCGFPRSEPLACQQGRCAPTGLVILNNALGQRDRGARSAGSCAGRSGLLAAARSQPTLRGRPMVLISIVKRSGTVCIR